MRQNVSLFVQIMAAMARMFTIYILVEITLVAILVAEKPELEILPSATVNQGENVTIICKVRGKDQMDLIRVVRQIKGKEYEISTNAHIKEQFTNTGRYYRLSYRQDKEVAAIKILIADITGADSGNIGCKLLSTTNPESVFTDLIVYVPPKKVEIKYKAKNGTMVVAEEGGTITLQENLDNSLICKVDIWGSDLEPTTTISLDDTDVTNRFKKKYVGETSHNEGLLKFRYTDTRSYHTKNPVHSDNKKTLRCRSKMPHMPVMVATAKMEVLYPPKFECKEHIFSNIGVKDAKISCKAAMNPPPDSAMWIWGKKPNRTILTKQDGNSTVPGYYVEEKVLDDDRVEFSLIIAEVNAADFRKYKLKTQNKVGNREFQMQLHPEVPKTTTTTTQAPSTSTADRSRFNSCSQLEHNMVLLATLVVLGALVTQWL